jgi:hypothetical protein
LTSYQALENLEKLKGIASNQQSGCVNCCGDGVIDDSEGEVCDPMAKVCFFFLLFFFFSNLFLLFSYLFLSFPLFQWLYGPSCTRPTFGNGCQFAKAGVNCNFNANLLGTECSSPLVACPNAVIVHDDIAICDRYCGNKHVEQCNPFYYPDGECDDEEMDCGTCDSLDATPGSSQCGSCYFRGSISRVDGEYDLTRQLLYLSADTTFEGTGCVQPPGFVCFFFFLSLITPSFSLIIKQILKINSFLIYRDMVMMVLPVVRSPLVRMAKLAHLFAVNEV